MKKKNITVSIDVYDVESSMPEEMQDLIVKAKESGENAYAPYSGFKVGVAVLLDNGEIITGNNQENAAYPSGLCAERVAVFYAKSQYPDVPIKQLAVIAIKDDKVVDSPVAPCGACCQVLVEYEAQQSSPLSVVMAGEKNTYQIDRASDLLPLSFGSKDL